MRPPLGGPAERALRAVAPHADRLRRLSELTRVAAKALSPGERLRRGAAHAVLAVAAASLAYLPVRHLGLREGFWAAITSLAVTQTEFAVARSTARDQIAGALIGATVGAGIAAAFGTGITAYAGGVAIAILAAWIVNIGTAARLAAITTTIILLVPHTGPVRHMVAARVGEVAWGVVAGLLVVWPFNLWAMRGRRPD